MKIETLSTFEIDDFTVRYRLDSDSGRVSLDMYPTALENQIAEHRTNLRADDPTGLGHLPNGWDPAAYALDSIVHLKIVGDPYTNGFCQGRTMRQSPSIDRFKYKSQDVIEADDLKTVVTRLESAEGIAIEHRLSWHSGDRAVEIVTAITNGSSHPFTLELLTSFSLGGITMFDAADAPEKLRVHRFRSNWSAEGRLESRSAEDLHLEPSWSGHGIYSERFGQVGTMPVRGWFPFLAAEDKAAGVTWGAQLAWPGSWQMEAYRRDDFLALSGGLADREFGHWTKSLTPGETLTSPTATVSCVHGGLDNLCDRLTRMQDRAVNAHPEIEQDLPVVFNEWCTTWGTPTHERLIGIAKKLRKFSTAKYLVIDAGWYKPPTGSWGEAHGDWVVSEALFPNGLKATADAIRAEGLIPGLWFEMENTGKDSEGFQLTDLLVKRDGIPVTTSSRRSWDLNNARAIDRLTERVIDLLDSCGFGYLKVDYNETIGIGIDGAESLGEGLRRHAAGIHRFFERIRQRLPHLVIENCSSGGHRLEPSMMARTAMSSFSDAHEGNEIPIVAANLHSLMLPRQSQIWAVLHADDSDKRLAYSLAATLLGRMCLSGDVDELDDRQWSIVQDAEQTYALAAPVIKYGSSRRTNGMNKAWRHPKGWQATTRVADDGKSALVVIHTFAEAPEAVEVTLPEGKWTIAREFRTGAESTVSGGNVLTSLVDGDFSGRAIVLTRD